MRRAGFIWWPHNWPVQSGDVSSFRSRLARWYRNNGRHGLPWRLTRDPYAILVSEVMLQQTQVERVLPYYEAWLLRWPSFDALAAASPADVIRAWSGLGYNRRALNLHRAAVLAARAGGLPRSLADLRGFPGVGPYTASAILSFAHELPVPVVDTNIGRVVARAVHGQPSARATGPLTIAETARSLLPEGGRRARDHNLALMDLGATVCTARSAACDRCPLARVCAWRAAGYPLEPRVPPKTERFEESARFARGRIIEQLRNADALSTDQLAASLPAAHGARIETYLAALARDGLIRRVGDRVSLATG